MFNVALHLPDIPATSANENHERHTHSILAFALGLIVLKRFYQAGYRVAQLGAYSRSGASSHPLGGKWWV